MSEESKNILNKLKELNKKKSLPIFLPSLNKKIKFLPFTLRQQKEILSKIPTDSSGLITFNNIFNNIISDNCEGDIDTKELNLFDRIVIIISYRIQTIGAVLDKEEGKVNLNDLIKKVSSYDFSKILSEEKIELKDISAILKIPSISYDEEINNQITKKIKKNATSQEIISELFTSEILKYIDKVTIEETTVDLRKMNYFDKLEIVEQLPGNFVKKIFKYIQDIKDVENELTTIDGIKIDASNELFS